MTNLIKLETETGSTQRTELAQFIAKQISASLLKDHNIFMFNSYNHGIRV